MGRLEDESWEAYISKKKPSSFSKHIADKYVDLLKEESDKLRKSSFEEFNKIQNKQFKGTELEGAESNIEEFYKHCEAIAENMLAVILKLEDDKKIKKIQFIFVK